jgi:protein-disulfide isomerase
MNRYAFLSALLILGLRLAAAENCPALLEDKKSALIDYVRKEYKIGGEVDLKLSKDELFGSTCYRELTLEGKSPAKTWQITMYLSPDQRFLTGELLDTTVDPVAEERRKNEILMAGLVPNKGASKGPDQAAVTIVEFSDFECPFCKKFAQIMQQVLPSEQDKVRIVFHHMPLPMHPWAHTAAEGAACAQLQSPDAFWAIHDEIFRHQQEITRDNIKQKLAEYARSEKLVDAKSFQMCLENDLSLGLVFRDMNLASANNIDATPTLFINGRRLTGIKDTAQLQRLIAEAKKESGVPSIAATTLPKTSGR